MKSFFKKFFTFDIASTHLAIAENKRDSLNQKIIRLKTALEEAYRERDQEEDRLGYV